jgi:hypothetical protein
MGSDNALVSLALSSEEGSNTSRMKTMAVYRFLTEIWDSIVTATQLSLDN